MKILFVAFEYLYADKSNGKDFITLDGFYEGLKKLGHEVVPFFYDEWINDHDGLNTKILEVAGAEVPDVIFFMSFQNEFRSETLRALKEKCITVGWFGDDLWRFETYTKHVANDYSWCVTTDPFSMKRYREIGQENVIYSQWSAIDIYDEPVFEGYKYDVTFVGGKSTYREWVIKELLAAGYKVKYFGYGWDTDSVSPGEMLSIFRHSKINLNIPNNTPYDIRCIYSDVFPLGKRLEMTFNLLFRRNYYLEKLARSKSLGCVKARLFEITYNGGFVLSDYTLGMDDYFQIGKDLKIYTTIEDLKLQIDHFLIADDEREAIRERGYKKANPAYGYTNRLGSILEQIG